MSWNKLDLTGQRFGNLRVLREAKDKKYGCVTWVCICDCGTIVSVVTTHLRRGSVNSCGCSRIEDLTGMRFGYLVVERLTDKRRGKALIWSCICDCGSNVFVSSQSLKRKTTVSCGCKKKKGNDLSGRRFGRLVAISVVGQLIVSRNYIWKCRCDCGGECMASSGNLISGQVKSCGCLGPEKTKERLGTRNGALQIARMHLIRNSSLQSADLPSDLVEAWATRIEINRELRRIL